MNTHHEHPTVSCPLMYFYMLVDPASPQLNIERKKNPAQSTIKKCKWTCNLGILHYKTVKIIKAA